MTKTYEQGYAQALKDYEELKKSNHEQICVELSINHAYALKGFWYTRKNGERDYKVIFTRYDKGYEKALYDLEGGYKLQEVSADANGG